MASGRKKYFRNYKLEQIPSNSKKGYKNVYTYIGDYYTWDISAGAMRAHRLLFAVLELMTAAAFLISALQDIALNKTVYIVIPAILSLCAWIFEIIAVCFFCLLKLPLKEEDFKRLDSTFFLTFMLRAVFLLFVTAVCLIDTVRFSLGGAALLTALGYMICAVIALAMHLAYRKLNQKKKVIPAE